MTAGSDACNNVVKLPRRQPHEDRQAHTERERRGRETGRERGRGRDIAESVRSQGQSTPSPLPDNLDWLWRSLAGEKEQQEQSSRRMRRQAHSSVGRN